VNEYAGPDDQVETLTYCPAKKRPGMSLDLFDRYWKDVHGPTCARVGFTWQYTQFHVAHDETGIWRVPDGVLQYTPPEEQVEGIAELTFRSTDDQTAWFDAAGVLARDEQNVFGETIAYLVTERRARTYVDRLPNSSPNGPLGASRYHVLLKKRPDVGLEDLRRYLTGTFAPHDAKHPLVLRFRLHLLDPYSQPWDAVDVENSIGAEREVHAAFEITFESRLQLAEFQLSDAYEAAVFEQARFVRQVSVFPEREAYVMVQEGRPTLAGLRSSSVAQTIVEAGAATNLDDDILELFSGGAITFASRAHS
jgi:hypothetical protein